MFTSEINNQTLFASKKIYAKKKVYDMNQEQLNKK